MRFVFVAVFLTEAWSLLLRLLWRCRKGLESLNITGANAS